MSVPQIRKKHHVPQLERCPTQKRRRCSNFQACNKNHAKLPLDQVAARPGLLLWARQQPLQPKLVAAKAGWRLWQEQELQPMPEVRATFWLQKWILGWKHLECPMEGAQLRTDMSHNLKGAQLRSEGGAQISKPVIKIMPSCLLIRLLQGLGFCCGRDSSRCNQSWLLQRLGGGCGKSRSCSQCLRLELRFDFRNDT